MCEPLHLLWSFWGILQDLNFNIESCFEPIWVRCLLETAVTVLYECIKAVEKKEAFYKWKAGLLKSLSECVQVIFLSVCVGLFGFFFALGFEMEGTQVSLLHFFRVSTDLGHHRFWAPTSAS